MSTMASKWKRLILSKQTNDWAQRAWSGQLESAVKSTMRRARRLLPCPQPTTSQASLGDRRGRRSRSPGPLSYTDKPLLPEFILCRLATG